MKLKKGLLITIFMLTFTLILSACADDGEVTKDTTNNKTGNKVEDSNSGDETAGNPEDKSVENTEETSEDNPGDLPESTFGFNRLELHVEMPELADALVAIYNEKDSTDMEYSNRFSEENVRGSDAKAVLEPMLKKLRITENLSDDEVIDQIVQAFPIKEGYVAIDAKVTFPNGETKEYHVVTQ